MKKIFSQLQIKLPAIISILLFLNSSLFSQQIISIGTGSSTNTNLPFNGYYNNSWSASIYKESEMMGIVGEIESISFHVSNALTDYSMFNQKIYMTSISDSTFSSLAYIDPTTVNAQLVYDDSILWNAGNQGWYELELSNPFVYVGGNLLILWENRDGSWSSSYPSFYHTNSPQSNMSKFNNQDNSFPLTDGSYEVSRPNIKMNLSYLDTNNIRIDELVSPTQNSIPNANQVISLGIENYSINPQDSFIVKYSIDGGNTFVSEVCLDTIQPYDTLVYNFSVLANMSTTALYNCIFIVSNTGDTINDDDTLMVDIWKGEVFHGNYTIGNSSVNDFSTISSACRALENFGVSDSTVFILSSDTFNEQVKLQGPIIGSSTKNKIIFKGHGNTTVVMDTSNSLNANVFSIIGTKNIVIDSLSILSGDSVYNCGIRIINSDSILIKNCYISVPTYSDTITTNAIIVSNSESSTAPTNSNYIVIQNNVVKGGYYGIGLFGKPLQHSHNIVIKDNIIKEYYYYGIYLNSQDSIEISLNEISDRGTSDNGYGIYISETRLGSYISSNNILSNFLVNGIGLYIGNCKASSINPFYIVNNMIVSIKATNSANGIHSYYGKHLRYFYNSVSINRGGINSRAINVNGGLYSASFADIQFVNNNVVNSGSGYSFYFEDEFYPNKVTRCNYNNMFTKGTKFAYYGSDKANLNTWQSSSQDLDSNSLSVNPQFLSERDLHTLSVPLNGKATPLSMVKYDIDGEIRDTLLPDIGADEYLPTDIDLGVLSIISKVNSYCPIAMDSVFVVVKNFGTQDIQNCPFTFYRTSPYDTLTYEDTIPSIKSWNNDTIFIGVLGASIHGLYNSKSYTSFINDTVSYNDTTILKVEYYQSENTGYVEDFITYPPKRWELDSSLTFKWQQYDTSIIYANFREHNQGDICEIISPNIKIPQQDTAYLGFQYSYFYNQNNIDSLEVLIKMCDEENWFSIWKEGGISLNTMGSSDTLGNIFNDVLITIPSFVQGDNIRVKFRAISYSGTAVYLQGMSVFMPPNINLGSDTSVCSADNFTLGIDNLFGAKYLWKRGLDTVGISNSYLVDASGTYTLEINQFGFFDYDTIFVNYRLSPIVNLGNDTTIMWINASLTLDAGNPNASWLWNTGATTQTETFDTLNLINSFDNLVFVEVSENGCTTTDSIYITVKNNTSIEKVKKNNGIIVYPNPNNGDFRVLIEGWSGKTSLQLVSVTGRVEYSNSFTFFDKTDIHIDVRFLSKGVYYLIFTNDVKKRVKRLIIE